MMRRGRGGALIGVLVLTLVGVGLVACGSGGTPQVQPLPRAVDPAQCDQFLGFYPDLSGQVSGYPRNQLAVTGNARANAVATPSPYATEAACRILASGGTAADAAIAAQYVLGVVEPQSSGPGGGGIVVYWDAATGNTVTFDGTVHAPTADSPEGVSQALASVGVPQTDRLMSSLRQRFGT